MQHSLKSGLVAFGLADVQLCSSRLGRFQPKYKAKVRFKSSSRTIFNHEEESRGCVALLRWPMQGLLCNPFCNCYTWAYIAFHS